MRQPGNLRVRQVSCTHAGGKLGRSCGSLVVGAAHQVFGACLILPQALQRSLRACALSCLHSSMLSKRSDRKGCESKVSFETEVSQQGSGQSIR